MNKLLILTILCFLSNTAHADNFALVNGSGVVDNIIVLDDGAVYTPPKGETLVKDDGEATIGGTYEDGEFVPPPPPVTDGGADGSP